MFLLSSLFCRSRILQTLRFLFWCLSGVFLELCASPVSPHPGVPGVVDSHTHPPTPKTLVTTLRLEVTTSLNHHRDNDSTTTSSITTTSFFSLKKKSFHFDLYLIPLLFCASLDGCPAMSTTAESRPDPTTRPSPAPSTTGSTGTSGITVRTGPNGHMSFRRCVFPSVFPRHSSRWFAWLVGWSWFCGVGFEGEYSGLLRGRILKGFLKPGENGSC